MVKIEYDGERKGSIYYWAGRWFGHTESKSWWVRNIAPCILVQHKLTRMAIEEGYDEAIFRPKIEVKTKKIKVKKTKKSKESASFVPLF